MRSPTEIEVIEQRDGVGEAADVVHHGQEELHGPQLLGVGANTHCLSVHPACCILSQHHAIDV